MLILSNLLTHWQLPTANTAEYVATQLHGLLPRWELALLKRGKSATPKHKGPLSHEDFSELKSTPATGPVATITIKSKHPQCLGQTFVVAEWWVICHMAHRLSVLGLPYKH